MILSIKIIIKKIKIQLEDFDDLEELDFHPDRYEDSDLEEYRSDDFFH